MYNSLENDPSTCSVGDILLNKIQSMIDNYYCDHEVLVRLVLINNKEYDFCGKCLFVRRIR